MTSVCVIGARGFVGRAVIAALDELGIESKTPPSVRGWSSDQLEAAVGEADVVINAAGLAAPDSADERALAEANAELPVRIAQAAARAGVRRLIHVSTAGVQGASPTLDETTRTAAFSPYTISKAAGEAALLDPTTPSPKELTIYRPTSVFGAERGITLSLHRLYQCRIAPILGNGGQPIPAALVENTGKAIAHLAVGPPTPPIVLHPSEGMTQQRIAEAFSAASTRLMHVPMPPRALARPVASRIAPDRIKPALRRLDLLAYGQQQNAVHLRNAGFELPDQFENYQRLANELSGGH